MDINISVIIPAYNAEASIEKTLMSVCRQSFPAGEIIVIDDGSTDQTAEVVARFPEVRYLKQGNRGPAGARNTGISQSKGSFVAFLDADDEWSESYLENCARVLRTHPGLKWMASAYALIRRDQQSEYLRLHTKAYQKDGEIRHYFKNNFWKDFIHTSSVIIQKDFLVQKKGFNESFSRGEDLDLWFRLALDEPVLGYNSSVSSRYILLPHSLTGTGPDLPQSYRRMVHSLELLTESKESMKRGKDVVNAWITRFLRNCFLAGNKRLIKELSAGHHKGIRIENKILMTGIRILPSSFAQMLNRWIHGKK